MCVGLFYFKPQIKETIPKLTIMENKIEKQKSVADFITKGLTSLEGSAESVIITKQREKIKDLKKKLQEQEEKLQELKVELMEKEETIEQLLNELFLYENREIFD